MPKTDSETHKAERVLGQSLSLHHLSSLILDVWFNIVQEKTWALTRAPGKPAHASAESPLSSVGDNIEEDRLGEMDWNGNVKGECVLENSPTKSPMLGSTSKDSRWDMERFLLNEERNRLCLWLSDFSTHELDQLLKAPANDALHIFGVVALESFIRIGDALLGQSCNGKDTY
ncbi:hypothetical protein CFIO01_04664 [Colletotrichum fioriniae PJ7]|uniref:Uncharacterized protein n=1 Tax=Colletotrichum fioriniae PJ7 TaxID=1445577 RepID=A0A010RLG9_9PEZI|nr:hypothetical protein CFIO01_04664 [Colletotrichum fioriniae PJ7]